VQLAEVMPGAVDQSLALSLLLAAQADPDHPLVLLPLDLIQLQELRASRGGYRERLSFHEYDLAAVGADRDGDDQQQPVPNLIVERIDS
jgi:hypothetical protein